MVRDGGATTRARVDALKAAGEDFATWRRGCSTAVTTDGAPRPCCSIAGSSPRCSSTPLAVPADVLGRLAAGEVKAATFAAYVRRRPPTRRDCSAELGRARGAGRPSDRPGRALLGRSRRTSQTPTEAARLGDLLRPYHGGGGLRAAERVPRRRWPEPMGLLATLRPKTARSTPPTWSRCSTFCKECDWDADPAHATPSTLWATASTLAARPGARLSGGALPLRQARLTSTSLAGGRRPAHAAPSTCTVAPAAGLARQRRHGQPHTTTVVPGRGRRAAVRVDDFVRALPPERVRSVDRATQRLEVAPEARR